MKHATMVIALTLSFLMPAFAHACGESLHDYGNGGIIQTPLSAKGRFVFVTKISRRRLREAVTMHQQPLRPIVMRAEI